LSRGCLRPQVQQRLAEASAEITVTRVDRAPDGPRAGFSTERMAPGARGVAGAPSGAVAQ
jgi:hypothetical protein